MSVAPLSEVKWARSWYTVKTRCWSAGVGRGVMG
jgi:hypothetical protein